MKTKSLRIGKRSLAMVLSLMMIVSSVFVGSLNGSAVTVDVENSEAKLNVEASESNGSVTGSDSSDKCVRIYYDGSSKAYKMSDSWYTTGVKNIARIFKNGDGNSYHYLSTDAVPNSTTMRYVEVPSGTYDRITLSRGGSSGYDNDPFNSNYNWGRTEDIILQSDCNNISKFAHQGNGSNSTYSGYVWNNTYSPISVSLTSNNSSNVDAEVGTSIPLTSSITNEDFASQSGTITKSFSVKKSGSTISENDYSWGENNASIIFNTPGTYTVTYSAVDSPNGFTHKVTKTSSVIITVEATTEHSTIGIKAQYFNADEEEGTAFADKSIYIGNTEGTTSLPTVIGGVNVSAPTEYNVGDVTYGFSGWTTTNGLFANSSSVSTMFYPGADNVDAVANYKKLFTITTSAGSNGTISVSKSKVNYGDGYTVTVDPDDGYELDTFTVNDNDEKGEVSNYTYNGTNVTSNITITATFKESEVKYMLYGNVTNVVGGSTGKSDVFERVGDSYIYKLETGKTISDLQSKSFYNFYPAKVEGENTIAKYKSGSSSGVMQDTNTPSKKYSTSDSSDTYFSFNYNNEMKALNGNVTFWFNSVTHDFWYTRDINTVKVIAKDGTVRSSFQKFVKIADTTVTGGKTCYNVDGADRAEEVYPEKGSTITVETTIHSPYKDTYYVKAFCVNGESFNVISKENANTSTGKYAFEYKIPEDQTDPIEITPIYFLIDESNTITFQVQDFDEATKARWGNTVACYAWYYSNGTIKDTNRDFSTQPALGGFPGQPMVKDGNDYFIQVPKSMTVEGSTYSVSGVTLNNYIWDKVHGDLQYAYADSDITAVQRLNAQTYDYDDFAALAKLNDVNDNFKDDNGIQNIVFRFKYRTNKNAPEKNQFTGDGITNYDKYYGYGNINTSDNNPANIPTSISYDSFNKVNGNGWEEFTNLKGTATDIFGNELRSGDKTKSKFYIVSAGYRNIYMGFFATLWNVYDSNYNLVATLPSSALFYPATEEELAIATPPQNFISHGDFSSNSAKSNTGKNGVTNEKQSYWDAYRALYEAGAMYSPAEITYDTAIYASWNKEYDPDIVDPALRIDGRWYYSRKIDTISSNIIIQYDDGSGVFVTDDIKDTHTGKVTNASAYFTNADFKGEINSGNVFIDTNNTFDFEANKKSTGTTKDGSAEQRYVFVGWYEYNDEGKAIPLTTNAEDSVLRTSGRTLIARYVPDDGESLSVIHAPYSTAPTPDPIASNGSVSELTVKVEILDKSNNDEVVYTFTNNDHDSSTYDEAYIPSDELVTLLQSYKDANPSNDDNSKYQVKITLTTEVADGGTVEEIYRRTDTTTTTKNPETGEDTDTTTHSYTATADESSSSETVKWTADKSNPDNNGVVTTTYTYNFRDLFDDDYNLKSKIIRLYSDASTTAVKVNFKYYDRNIIDKSQPATIDPEETTVEIATNLVNNSISETITTALEETTYDKDTGKQIKMSEIGNVIDDYYFWPSQNEATGDSGIKALANYHTTPTVSEDGEAIYTTYGKSNLSNLEYHLDCYGNPLLGDDESIDESNKWVTYKTTDGTDGTVKAYDSENFDTADLRKITEITVWGYNAPKQYKVSVSKPKSGTSTLTASSEEEFGTDVYIASGENNVASDVKTAFYNQRLGGKDTTSDIQGQTNAASDYLKAYGIGVADDETGKTGEAYVGGNVVAVAEVKNTVGGNVVTYVFDGWYDTNTKKKVSSDLIYGYRVTANLSIVAGYKLDSVNGDKVESARDTAVGLTVTSNGVDSYIDGTDGKTQRVRLNTQVNVYNAYSEEGDEHIKNIAAIYVKVNGYEYKKNEEALRAAITNHLNTLIENGDIKPSTTTERIDNNGQIIYYTYTVVWDDDFNSSGTEADKAKLTNKNRLQFTLPMKETAFDSTILSFAAIYYDGESPADAEYNNSKGFLEDSNERKSTTKWILSDNYVEFIPESEP